ncbi:type 1 fimbrial protein [Paenalcaligenes suwonensis]|uniref:type 1 fimbrial protein n=1 Tax=Paenalcaligenes suwonensis TaxID=1202713 RepID=UPI00140BCA18|nr:type 1 fimbrial protein [Paenalcaligenes suwonensis]NHC61067.1 type 1 fimbrial protein [Paenalcaligenes suwonensis]
MKARTYFSAMAATLLIAMSATPAVAQQTGEIRFFGEIVNGSCSPTEHTSGAYAGKDKLSFDLQFNDCLGEIQQAVEVSVDAKYSNGNTLSVAMNAISSGVDIVLSPAAQQVASQRERMRFHVGGENKVTPLGIRYSDAVGQPTPTAEKVYVILNLQYV